MTNQGHWKAKSVYNCDLYVVYHTTSLSLSVYEHNIMHRSRMIVIDFRHTSTVMNMYDTTIPSLLVHCIHFINMYNGKPMT